MNDYTDVIEQLKIQYGTSMLYPISSMGSHVSAIPNHQLHPNPPLKTRGDVAYFGTFGYELDPKKLSEHEKEEIKKQISFMKEYRELIQFGTFYRLCSPFHENDTAWMIVSKDQSAAIVRYYRVLRQINAPYRRLKLSGLNPEFMYSVSSKEDLFYGQDLMKVGLIISDSSASENNDGSFEGDYLSRLFILKKVD